MPAFWLALALLGAQALGQWHAVLHAPAAGQVVAQMQGHGHGPGHGHGQPFDDHAAGDAECRLYDHLLQGDPLVMAGVSLTGLAAAPTTAAMAWQAAQLAPLWRPLARGPPLLGFGPRWA